MKYSWLLYGIFFLILLVVPVTASSTVSIESGEVAAVGESTTLGLVLNQTANGLSGCNISIALDNPAIATITGVTFPAWTSLQDNSTLPAKSVWMNGADLQETLTGNLTNVDLGSITLVGELEGTTGITLTVNALDDSNGTAIPATTLPGTFIVHGPAVIAPVADFTVNTSSGTSPLSVQFADNSSGTGPFSYEWNFGDGSPNVTTADPVHTFVTDTQATYTVTMTVSNSAGSSSIAKAITVNTTETTNPPDSITNLHNTTYQQTLITWNWTDPSSDTFDQLVIYLDGVFQANVTKGAGTFTAANLSPGTMHTLGTRTAGTTGLINDTWVNHTATTAPSEGASSFTVTLNSGWNLFSTPVLLAPGHSQFSQIFPAGDQEKIVQALGWDGSLWYAAQATDEVTPLYAFYITVKEGEVANATIVPSTSISSPPARALVTGWNLIGPAPAYEDGGFSAKPVEDSLITIEGDYRIVVSPGLHQPGWSYVQGGTSRDLLPYKGYWVFMDHPDTLAGFSTTPL